MNIIRTHLLGLVLFVSFGICQETTAQKQVFESSKDSRIREVLNQQVMFVYDETPFEEIMDELRTNFRIGVYLDRSARDDSLTEDDLVTIEIGNVSIGSGLRLILSQYNADFIVRDDILLIISKDVIKNPEFLVQKIINCESILKKLRAVHKDREATISGVYRVGELAGVQADLQGLDLVAGNQIDGLVDVDGKVDPEEQAKTWFFVDRQSSAEAELIKTIKSCVAPDDWDTTNGNGSVILVGNCIVVQNTEHAIKQIEGLLAELSAKLDQEE